MPSSRQFNITMPADALFHNLYTLMLAVPGAVPVNGILPKSVMTMNILLIGATTINIADNNFANNTGDPVTTANPNWYRVSNRNTIFIPDYYVAGNAATFSIDFVTA